MRALAAALAVVALLAAPAASLADGDPASDVLVSEDVFFPYAPPTRGDLERALERTVRQAREAGYPVKVALIASAADLGAYPRLYNRANEYATLLSRELPRSTHGRRVTGQRILVVMPGGFGGVDLGEGVDAALADVPIQADAGSDGLAVAAMAAVAKLATANGHRVPVPPEASVSLEASEGGGGPSALVYLAPAAVLFVVLLVLGRRKA